MRAVFSALDDQRFRAQLENVPRGAQQVVLVRKLARFRVVDHQDVGVLAESRAVPPGVRSIQ